MATAYYTPGVYMEEVDRGPKPIQGVSTSVAAFIGFTERSEQPGKAELVTNWNQYLQKFGGFVPGAYLPHAVSGYFDNGGQRCYIISIGSPPTIPAQKDLGSLTVKALARGREGNALKVIVEYSNPNPETETPAPKEEAAPEGPSDKAAEAGQATTGTPAKGTPKGGADGAFTLSVMLDDIMREQHVGVTLGSKNNVKTVVAENSSLIEVEIPSKVGAITDRRPPEGRYKLEGFRFDNLPAVTSPQFRGDPTERRGLGALEALDDVTIVACPDLMSTYLRGNISATGVQAIQQAILDHCALMKYRFAILDAPPLPPPKPMSPGDPLRPQMMSAKQIEDWRYKEVQYDSKYGALYYPWIEVADPFSENGGKIQIPPCGHVAGIYARTDSERGVHKAPANEIVRGALSVEINVTKGEQEGLNPKGVNCIRAFPGRGVRVWGARTLSDDPAWRYINVRRLFNYVEASIEGSTQWIVFEPNDSVLWAKVNRDVRSFLRTVWLSGALFGATPEEAFYVKCDEELNPADIRDLGQLIVEIGMAPVKPAEFVIFRISQWTMSS